MSDQSDSPSQIKKERENTIFVGNLPYTFNENDVRNIFKNIKTLGHIYLPRDSNHHIRGFGFVSFGNEEDAVKAMRLYDNSTHCGKQIRCRWGNESTPQNPESSQEFFDKEKNNRSYKDRGRDKDRDRDRDRDKDRGSNKRDRGSRSSKYRDDYSDDEKSKRKRYHDYDDDSHSRDRGKNDSKRNDELDVSALIRAAKVNNEEQLAEKITRSPVLFPLIQRQMFNPLLYPPNVLPQFVYPPGSIPGQMLPPQAQAQLPVSQLPQFIPPQGIAQPVQPQPSANPPPPQMAQLPQQIPQISPLPQQQQPPPQAPSLYQIQ